MESLESYNDGRVGTRPMSKLDKVGLYHPEFSQSSVEDDKNSPPDYEEDKKGKDGKYIRRYPELQPGRTPDVLDEDLKTDSVEVKYTGKEHVGDGLYARKKIDTGEDIFEFDGIRVGEKKSVHAATDDYSSHSIVVGVSRKNEAYFVYATPNRKSPLRFLNHSCNPNAARKPGDMFGFVALRPIEPGEEITADYSLLEVNPYWKMGGCGCGAENCRHDIGDVSSLPVEYLVEHWERLTLEMQQYAIRFSRDPKIAEIRNQMGAEYLTTLSTGKLSGDTSYEEILTSNHPTIVAERNLYGAKQLAPHFLERFGYLRLEKEIEQADEMDVAA